MIVKESKLYDRTNVVEESEICRCTKVLKEGKYTVVLMY